MSDNAGSDETQTDRPDLSPDLSFVFEPPLREVLACLNGQGGETRVVGGAVRNTLLGLSIVDVDLATTLLPDDVIRRARGAGLKAVPTGIEHGTVTVVADAKPFEVTTLREDVQTFGRHAEVVFGIDWALDASRRDFTMNALYLSADSTLHDPLGGAEDIMARRVRFIGEPAARIREDYLRIVRFFRFQAGYGEGAPDPEIVAEIGQHLEGLSHVSAERIRAELGKMLPMPGALQSLEAMERIGLLQQLIGTPPHIDSFARLGILERALPPYDEKAAWVLRLAALVGPDSLNGDLAAMVAHRLKLSRVEQARLSRMVANMAHPLDAAMSEDAARAAIYRLSPNGFLDWLVASWTVNEGGTMGDYARLAALALHWKPPEFPLSGRDIAAHGVAPGPAVGEALRVLEEVWISSDFQLTKDQLLERMGHRLH